MNRNLNRRQFLNIGGKLFLFGLVGCAAQDATVTPSATALPPASATIAPTLKPPTPMPIPSPTPAVGDGIELETKIGQMLMVGFRGFQVTPQDPIYADLHARNLGSVVLFQYDAELLSYSRNVQSPAQLKALNQALQAAAQTPLFICTDQEGGIINRLTPQDGFPPTHSEAYYGNLNQPAVTRAAAAAEGKILADMGINLNLAPVVDLNINPNNPIIGKYERSFSADPAIVTANAIAAIEGYHSQKVLCTLKHFPGHGSSTTDSHTGFVDVTNTWSPIELEPYINIIQAGLADAVMTAHIFNAKLDPHYPATLSKAIVTGILREQLGYDGVVISDDMQMGAISQYYGLAQALELSINAGVDILAIANNLVYDPNVAAQAISIVKQLVADGKVSPERIDQSYQRIARLKARL